MSTRKNTRQGLLASLLAILLVCSSCCTSALWESYEPEGYIQIPYAEISEQELQEKDLPYLKDDETASYYVPKSGMRKLSEYSVRLLATPVTIAVDAAVIVIRGVALSLAQTTITITP